MSILPPCASLFVADASSTNRARVKANNGLANVPDVSTRFSQNGLAPDCASAGQASPINPDLLIKQHQ